MDVYTWVIFLYVAGTLTVGWFLLHEALPTSHKSKEKFVGPTYWGFYNGSIHDSDKNIVLHELKDDDLNGLCGGNGYASGRAVKSGRV
ncbi:MAG: hypothetical protein K2X27_18325 [Candidatus Obscuribacterales bacterium]|nr:hypothetical protein [Candidatus Obscuribacterales bacterium]